MKNSPPPVFKKKTYTNNEKKGEMAIVDIPLLVVRAFHSLPRYNIFLHSWGSDTIARRRAAANCMLCLTLFALLTMVARTSMTPGDAGIMLGAIGVSCARQFGHSALRVLTCSRHD